MLIEMVEKVYGLFGKSCRKPAAKRFHPLPFLTSLRATLVGLSRSSESDGDIHASSDVAINERAKIIV